LAHYPNGVPGEIATEAYPSLVALMEESFQRYRDLPAYRYMGSALSFGQWDDQSRALAAWLQAQGLQPGDRVAVMLPNVPPSCVRAWWWSTSTRCTRRANSSTSSRTRERVSS
jgi:long-chain acyl-CoA synthetase